MKTVWEKLDKDGVKAVMDFNEEYRQFLTKSKEYYDAGRGGRTDE